jgi:hypothetical protein
MDTRYCIRCNSVLQPSKRDVAGERRWECVNDACEQAGRLMVLGRTLAAPAPQERRTRPQQKPV